MIPDWAKLKPVNSITTNNTGSRRMIVQEMVEALQSVPLNISSTRRGGGSGLRNAKEVLAAVYPLIRNQVLEEAANYYDSCDEGIIASSICNLKDKTDEAHNG